jgi:hypothetical protein
MLPQRRSKMMIKSMNSTSRKLLLHQRIALSSFQMFLLTIFYKQSSFSFFHLVPFRFSVFKCVFLILEPNRFSNPAISHHSICSSFQIQFFTFLMSVFKCKIRVLVKSIRSLIPSTYSHTCHLSTCNVAALETVNRSFN